MHLLLEILQSCADVRPEVRMDAIQTLFMTLQVYGATLSLDTGRVCLEDHVPVTRHPHRTECAHTSIITRHHHSRRRCGYCSVGLVVVGRIKGGHTTINRRDPKRHPRVEDHTLVLVQLGMGNLGHPHPRRILAR